LPERLGGPAAHERAGIGQQRHQCRLGLRVADQAETERGGRAHIGIHVGERRREGRDAVDKLHAA